MLHILYFSLTDKEVIATIEKIEGGEKLQSILVSNEPAYVGHFHSIFGDLGESSWCKKFANINRGGEEKKRDSRLTCTKAVLKHIHTGSSHVIYPEKIWG